jgi:hypothetical protein
VKYKNIKSAAHNAADSFASSENYDSDDYIMSHLSRRVLETGERELRVDLLSGEADPPALVVTPVARSIARTVEWFPKNLIRQNIEPERIRSATMRFVFENARVSDDIGFPDHKEIPFDAWVTVLDDRGVQHIAHFRRWWSFRADRPEFNRSTVWERVVRWWRGGG